MDKPIYSLEVSQLVKAFPRTKALDGLSLRFQAKTMHGLIGPEGAGKTTLLRCLVGLLRPDAGAVRYWADGREQDFVSIRPQIAYMPQQQSLYADLSVGEHLDFFRDLFQLPKAEYQQRRQSLLEITRLAAFVHRPAGKLSGGMYKKLGLMCALLRSPSILILDEPTNGVDPISRREFWDLLYALGDQNILIIVATAYMDEAERCGEVHLLNQGQVLAAGEPKTLLADWGAKNIDEIFLREADEHES
jgi:ABC-2 type transport system ATP-binding protein